MQPGRLRDRRRTIHAQPAGTRMLVPTPPVCKHRVRRDAALHASPAPPPGGADWLISYSAAAATLLGWGLQATPERISIQERSHEEAVRIGG